MQEIGIKYYICNIVHRKCPLLNLLWAVFTSSSQQITVFIQKRTEILKMLHEDPHEILYESEIQFVEF